MRRVPRSVDDLVLLGLESAGGDRGLEAGVVAGRDRQRGAEREHRRDGLLDRDLAEEKVAQEGAVADHAEAGVVVRLGGERPGTGGQKQRRNQDGSEHRWKMSGPFRRVNARCGRTRAGVAACDGRR